MDKFKYTNYDPNLPAEGVTEGTHTFIFAIVELFVPK